MIQYVEMQNMNMNNTESLSYFQTNIQQKDTTMTKWKELPDLQGMGDTTFLGVSAPFAGITEGQLIVTGGCNFPDKPVTEGGKKRYYNDIMALDLTASEPIWKNAGTLPYTIAYGASVSTPVGIVCIGGNNEDRSMKESFLLTWNGRSVTYKELPMLPSAIDNAAATYADGYVYLAGGNMEGKPSTAFFRLKIYPSIEGSWSALQSFPGVARIQPVLAAQQSKNGTKIYLSGGFCSGNEKTEPSIPTNLLSFNIEAQTWEVESELPKLKGDKLRSLTGGCATAYDNKYIYFIGGVNYQCFYDAIDRPRQLKLAKESNNIALIDKLTQDAKDYMYHDIDWYKFNTSIIRYDTYTCEWQDIGDYKQSARAGAVSVIFENKLIIINGELKPGIRTPKVSVIILP